MSTLWENTMKLSDDENIDGITKIQSRKHGIFLPIEVADAITVETLKDALSLLKNELEQYENGEWLHEDDVKLNNELIPALEKIIWYFGG